MRWKTAGCFHGEMNDIDLVVPWVDGNDPKWQQERNKYLKYRSTNPGYYQDWGWMRYWFRCVEQNLPWIRHVFFVTCGHTPGWLNLDHPKLKVIKHKDFMPPEFLPTFNSNSISLNVHRIEGLSETFIYAEDDIFFIGKQRLEDFFSKSGQPKDCLWLKPITEQCEGDYAHSMLNNVLLLKRHLGMHDVLANNEASLFSCSYPEAVNEDNAKYLKLAFIPGFKETHLAYSLTKSSFEQLWSTEAPELYKTSMHKFRTISDVTIALVRDWQLANGNFSPCYQEGRYFANTSSPNLKELIQGASTTMLCINESSNQSYSKERADEICSYFEKRFPEKSSFELD